MKHEMGEGVNKTRKQSKTADNFKMGPDLFTYLPSEIILNILLRLPAPTIMSCKCVCKPWLDLLTTPEFVKSHLSKSVAGLAVYEWDSQSKPFKIVEFVEMVDLNRGELDWNVVVCNFDLPFRGLLLSSANGLLFLHNGAYDPGEIVLCNPITRDYIKIPCRGIMYRPDTFGFGVSRMSRQYKVVRIFLESTETPLGYELECQTQIYTVGIGTGSWRGIASDDSLTYEANRVGAFLNGSLHWLAEKGSSRRISCLDLETEVFSSLSSPPLDDPNKCRSLAVLGDCLCLCDNISFEVMFDYEVHIWLMKAYGDEKSWTKEFVIRKVNMSDYLGPLCPVKVFKDGDIIMEPYCGKLVCFSNKTNTIQEAHDVLGLASKFRGNTITFTPSFFSLKNIVTENVISF